MKEIFSVKTSFSTLFRVFYNCFLFHILYNFRGFLQSFFNREQLRNMQGPLAAAASKEVPSGGYWGRGGGGGGQGGLELHLPPPQ